MVDSPLAARVKLVLAQAWDTQVDAIPDDAALNDYERWDSLGHITLVLALGAEFGFELTAETVQELRSVPRIVDFLEKKLSAVKESPGVNGYSETMENTHERHCSPSV